MLSNRSDAPTLLRSFRGHAGPVTAVAFHPAVTQVLSGSVDCDVVGWSFDPKLRASRAKGHADAVLALDFAPTARHFASGSRDKTIRVWTPSVSAQPLPAAALTPPPAESRSAFPSAATPPPSDPSRFRPTAPPSPPPPTTKPSKYPPPSPPHGVDLVRRSAKVRCGAERPHPLGTARRLRPDGGGGWELRRRQGRAAVGRRVARPHPQLF